MTVKHDLWVREKPEPGFPAHTSSLPIKKVYSSIDYSDGQLLLIGMRLEKAGYAVEFQPNPFEVRFEV